MILNKHRTT